MRLLFIPFSIVAGLIAGFAGKKIFEQVWSLVDDEEPPEAEHRDATWARSSPPPLSRGRSSARRRCRRPRARTAFANVTGSWPGEERPDRDCPRKGGFAIP